MLAVTARLHVRPTEIARFEALAAALWQQSHARESGLRRYEYVRRAEVGAYLVLMLFDSYDAFITHQASPHHAQLAGEMRDLIVTIEVEIGEPVAGAFGVPETADGAGLELVIDESRRADYAARYPLPDSAWWRGNI